MKSDKGILFVMNSYPGIGGIETVTNTLISFFKNYFQVYVVAFYKDSRLNPSIEKRHYFYFYSENQLDKNIAFYNQLIADNKISIVINQGVFSNFSPIVFNDLRDRDVRIFSCMHGAPKYEERLYWLNPNYKVWSKNKLFLKKLRAKLGISRSYNQFLNEFQDSYSKALIEGQKVVLLCDAYCDMFVRKYVVPKSLQDKICAIYNPMRKMNLPCLPYEKKENILLYVGRLSSEKRIEHILDIWKEIHELVDWKLMIVGDGEERATLEDLASRMNLKRVEFCGQTDSPERYYQRAKSIILTSSFEGFGMTLLEAQSYGVVPICYRISQGVEAIVEDDNGILVEYEDKKELKLQLLNFMKDETLQITLYYRVQKSSDRFKVEEIGKQWLSMFNE